MADLLPNTTLPAGVMVDIYAATGLSVGTNVLITNCGNNRVRLYEKASTPDPNADGYIPLTAPKEDNPTIQAQASNTPSGLFAYSDQQNGLINVQEIV